MLTRGYSLGRITDAKLLERLLPLFVVWIIRAIILICVFDVILNEE